MMRRRGCVRNLVGGHIIWTSVASRWTLGMCPFAGGFIMLLCVFRHTLGVSVSSCVLLVVQGSCSVLHIDALGFSRDIGHC